MPQLPDPSIIRSSFGERIRHLRKAKGWSQEKLAEECDLHRTYIGAIERGEQNVSLENIVRISVCLHIKASDIFNDLPY